MFGDGYRLVEFDAALFQGGKHQIGSHQLGQRGRFDAFVGLEAGQFLVGADIQQQPGAGGDGWRRRCALRLRLVADEQQQAGQQQRQEGVEGGSRLRVPAMVVVRGEGGAGDDDGHVGRQQGL